MKNKTKWISGLALLLFVVLTTILWPESSDEAYKKTSVVFVEEESAVDDSLEGDSNNIDVDSKIDIEAIHVENIEIDSFDEHVEALVKQVQLGNSESSILDNYGDAYQFIMETGFDGITLLKVKREEVRAFVEENHEVLLDDVREKQCIEWLISDIIRNQAVDCDHIRDEYCFTIISTDIGYGRMSPDLSGETWAEIPKDTVVQITGFYDMEWMLAKLIVPSSEISIDYSENFMKTDCVEFWLHEDDFVRETTWYTDIWEQSGRDKIAITYARSFNYMVNVHEEDAFYKSFSLLDSCNHTPIRLLPDKESNIIGYMDDNNLVTLKNDAENKAIRREGWVLVGQFEQDNDTATMGWIEEELIEPLTLESKPNQGYILRGTRAYENLEGTSSPEFDEFFEALLKFSSISPIYVKNRKDGWVQFIDTGYTIGGWVKESEVIYQITDDVMTAIYHPAYDLELFVATLKSEISDNTEFKIKAYDVEATIVLTEEEKKALASSLDVISGYEIFDGGIAPAREAAYPFISLEFGDYSMVVTSDDRLLLLLGNDWSYAYGIGSEGASVRWVEPNEAFLMKIKTLVSDGTHSRNPEGMNVYFMADSVCIYDGDRKVFVESESQEHVNKCLRGIKAAIGNEIIIDDPDVGITEKYEFEFRFDSDSEMGTTNVNSYMHSIIHTNRYILWNGNYYEALETPHNIQSQLFAGYF